MKSNTKTSRNNRQEINNKFNIIDKVIKYLHYSLIIINNIQDIKELIKTIKQDEDTNKYYYDKMISDFELESRHNTLIKANKKKWRSESLKYLERVHNMKEKNEENFNNRIDRLQKSLNAKDIKIKNKLIENKKNKEQERKHSHDIFSQKEQRARDTYNRKLQMDEDERTENERKLMHRSN